MLSTFLSVLPDLKLEFEDANELEAFIWLLKIKVIDPSYPADVKPAFVAIIPQLEAILRRRRIRERLFNL
jgi:hypothetical protein